MSLIKQTIEKEIEKINKEINAVQKLFDIICDT